MLPRDKEIASNGYRRKLDANFHIVMKKSVTKINNNNYRYMQFLDALDELQTSHVDSENPYFILRDYASKQNLDKLKLIRFAKKYYRQRTLPKLLDIFLKADDEI